MDDNYQTYMLLLKILTKKLGGTVIITEEQLREDIEGTITVNPDRTIELKVK